MLAAIFAEIGIIILTVRATRLQLASK